MNASLITAKSIEANDASRAAALNEYETKRIGPLTAPLISTIAFPAMRHFADDWVELIDAAEGRDINQTLPPGTPASVRKGYQAQRRYQIPLLRNPTEGAVEILADSVGTLSVAMQRPLSRGTVRPASADIFDSPPLVDPRYCSEPFDCLVLARALLFNCALVRTRAMAELRPVVQEPYFCPDDLSPGGAANNTAADQRNVTDSRMLELARQYLATEFHPSGSTAMLPLDLGGVVDTELRVYGTEGLRVVDAGVMPMVLGAHLQAAVYAIAERAAGIISDHDVSGGEDSGRPART
ncbi:putative gmc oxidoreductase [Diaporthe ampelina]|uniref:Putative gmc oxidoreductase n=1 Tax=Diaporthe ampelina TaxID=1214573 RepID=A0A0G2IB24_9PEZI|nr:putative gmc oxidoreductase [Diaporthe ampelina]